MKRIIQSLVVLGCCLVVSVARGDTPAIASGAPLASGESGGLLAQYVRSPDASYGWKVVQTVESFGVEVTELELTSQVWRGITWKHQLLAIRPRGTKDVSNAILVIDGGNWPPAPDALASPDVMAVCVACARFGVPMFLLRQVPFQPIFGKRVEDAAVAYSFGEFLKSTDNDWPLLLPMVKSAVQAMTAGQALAREKWGGEIRQFLVTGGSKRGWTTWLTAAVDDRVGALAPVVFDMLDMPAQLDYHVEILGKPSDSLRDYQRVGLFENLQTPRGKELVSIVDPISYREQIPQPKLIILGTNDPFWITDSLNLYWDKLAGEKRVLYIPNGNHFTVDMPRHFGAVAGLMDHMTRKADLPNPTWDFAQSGRDVTISIDTRTTEAATVRIWSTTGSTRNLGRAKWVPLDLPPQASGKYSHTITIPDGQCGAMFGEIVYPRPTPLYLSTTIYRSR